MTQHSFDYTAVETYREIWRKAQEGFITDSQVYRIALSRTRSKETATKLLAKWRKLCDPDTL